MIFEVKKKIKGNFIYFHRTGAGESETRLDRGEPKATRCTFCVLTSRANTCTMGPICAIFSKQEVFDLGYQPQGTVLRARQSCGPGRRSRREKLLALVTRYIADLEIVKVLYSFTVKVPSGCV